MLLLLLPAIAGDRRFVSCCLRVDTVFSSRNHQLVKGAPYGARKVDVAPIVCLPLHSTTRFCYDLGTASMNNRPPTTTDSIYQSGLRRPHTARAYPHYAEQHSSRCGPATVGLKSNTARPPLPEPAVWGAPQAATQPAAAPASRPQRLPAAAERLRTAVPTPGAARSG